MDYTKNVTVKADWLVSAARRFVDRKACWCEDWASKPLEQGGIGGDHQAFCQALREVVYEDTNV